MIGLPAPEIFVEQWVQGDPGKLLDLRGQVVLIEVFQVNCLGCFLHGLPEVIRLYDLYHERGLEVLGVATAFEDFDTNTLDNLVLLLEQQKMTEGVFKALRQHNILVDNQLPWEIPFPVGMDIVTPETEEVTDERVIKVAEQNYPDLLQRRPEEQDYILRMMRQYLNNRIMRAETFDLYRLQGTPSSILIDQQGLLCDVSFARVDHLQAMIEDLL